MSSRYQRLCPPLCMLIWLISKTEGFHCWGFGVFGERWEWGLDLLHHTSLGVLSSCSQPISGTSSSSESGSHRSTALSRPWMSCLLFWDIFYSALISSKKKKIRRTIKGDHLNQKIWRQINFFQALSNVNLCVGCGFICSVALVQEGDWDFLLCLWEAVHLIVYPV